jgi:ribosomal protein L37AE/L43A
MTPVSLSSLGSSTVSGFGASSSKSNPIFWIVIYKVETTDPEFSNSLIEEDNQVCKSLEGDWQKVCPYCGNTHTKRTKVDISKDKKSCQWIFKCDDCGKSYDVEKEVKETK